MNPYVLLLVAVLAEIIGTTALKASYGMTRLIPASIVVVGYCIAFWTMSLTLKVLPVGVVYAIWCGLGIMGIALIGVFYYGEAFGLWHLLGLLCIIAGVVILSAVTVNH
ncbi:MAG: multidrug efflux SMR transporter [Verrucomicrobia bacterium]|nr:multidrug efflux SMR transporter [Verrucomicrobiota bacterium]MBS0636527.1 multidrug efflux SMR transporter [Verrucomicrobiota bacterium]